MAKKTNKQSGNPAPKPAPAPVVHEKATGLDGWFHITKRGSNVSREVRGGLVTFFTMAYIIALNPLILGTGTDIEGKLINGQYPSEDGAIAASMAAVAAVTALIAGIMTILMGVIGRYPVALATGLGINSMVGAVLVRSMTWGDAMGLVVWDGIIILVLVFTGFREAVFRAVPKALRIAISVGIGLFIAFIGLVDGGVVRSGIGTITTFAVSGSIQGFPLTLFLIGLVLIIGLHLRKTKGAILIAIIATTVIGIGYQYLWPVATQGAGNVAGWASNAPTYTAPDSWLPDFSLIGNVDLFGGFYSYAVIDGVAVQQGITFTGFLTGALLVFSLLLADFFDTMGTVVAIGTEGGLLDANGEPEHLREILVVDSIGAIAGGLGSVSSNTAYVESAAGVAEGARTGLASVVTGASFLAAVFLSPFVSLVPAEAVAPALVFVGFLMMQQVGDIEWKDGEIAIPAFLAIIMMPFGYSISVGIGWGFIAYVIVKIIKGKTDKVHPLMWVSSALFVIYFIQGPILDWLAS
jgi:AGZA family xanthine/uracil permease-like MFS transporter